MSESQSLRRHLLRLLRGGDAHIHFDDLIADFPEALINGRVEGVPYTPWQVLEHMHIAQWDIMQFAIDADHVSPEFPKGYWPAVDAEADLRQWNETVESFRTDLRAMEELVQDQETNLFAQIPHGDGQTILRQALLVADHNAYHLGVLALLKRILEKR